mgnify:CR=1 FL=1
MSAIARTDTSLVGRWSWTIDRWTLAALGAIIAIGAVLTLAASPPVAERLGLDTFHFAKRQFLFLGLACVGFYFSYKNPLGFLALSGTLLATYASFQKAEKRVRAIFGLSAIIWIAHNILVRSPVAALMEATLQASNAVGYWRFHRSNKYTSD